MLEKQYKLSINPRILELLGPSLYTNIYYVLAELIANAYDADAKNVYIISNKDDITVEDDGRGMSYSNGEVFKYLDVAAVSRNTPEESITKLHRKKMGRKGVGKLASLSVSENVLIKTISETGEKSGFILSRHVEENNELEAIPEDEIVFSTVKGHGTAVVMQNPQYRLHSTSKAIKRNLLKIFPFIDKTFVIHIIREKEHITINDFDKEMISELATLILLGEDYAYLKDFFKPKISNDETPFLKQTKPHVVPITMNDKMGSAHEYNVEIKGWIGTYLTTKGRKSELTDFPDNFLSLYANEKMGEFNILPVVGQNKLNEVYVVGQLHVDIFELTELPDMALSNRQGYKSDDKRYQVVLDYVRKILLPEILKLRDQLVAQSKKKKKEEALLKQNENEEALRQSVDKFKMKASSIAAGRIAQSLGISGTVQEARINLIVNEEINSNILDIGLKRVVDSQKRKILISQTYADKDLADVVYLMLLFNGVQPEDIIYTNCDDEVSRVPEGDTGKSGVYRYLRDFFVDSYSTQKMYVLFITSHNTKLSWGALTEVGAAWITQIEHKIFNIKDFRPEHPLDDEAQWHTSFRDDSGLCMSKLGVDIFAQKIEYVCNKLGYKVRTRYENRNHLENLVKVTEH